MPDAFQAQHTNTLLSAYSVLKPEKLDELFQKNEKQGYEYFLLIRALGWMMEVSQESYSHWEDLRIHENFNSKTTVASPGVAGNPISIVLSATDLDASNRYYPRVGDDIPFGNGASTVVGIITAIDDTSDPTAPVLTIYPKQVADTLPGVTAGDTLFIMSNSFGEGTDQPAARFSGVQEITNYLKKIKETINSTGTALTDSLWFTIPWANIVGEGVAPAGSYYRKAFVDMEYRMALSIGGALQFDENTTNTTPVVDATYGTVMKGTIGLFPATRTYGTSFNYTPGTLSIADFNYFDRVLAQQHVSNKTIMFMQGSALYQENEDLLYDYLLDTNIKYENIRRNVTDTLFGKMSEREVSVGFGYFEKSGRTYAFKRNFDYDNPQTYGSTGYDYPNLGILIPLGKSRDKSTGKSVGSIGCRYKKLGSYNREFEMWNVGGAGNIQKTDGVDRILSYSRADIGAHQIAANRFIVVQAA
jgi:hypothetical protein